MLTAVSTTPTATAAVLAINVMSIRSSLRSKTWQVKAIGLVAETPLSPTRTADIAAVRQM
jgi:hypothetical protein